ncbi:hypothetical protein ACIA8O_08590 [Kitasatospora sp. NPDC051853]|uniref:hypothetical protein n=1 Tax=Kitasatospora sp. NPDC051853 TaxID=3364058 RepID=UPI0037AF8026
MSEIHVRINLARQHIAFLGELAASALTAGCPELSAEYREKRTAEALGLQGAVTRACAAGALSAQDGRLALSGVTSVESADVFH